MISRALRCFGLRSTRNLSTDVGMHEDSNTYLLEFASRDRFNRLFPIVVAIDPIKSGISISDHYSHLGCSYNMWAPGSPRSDSIFEAALTSLAETTRAAILKSCSDNGVDVSAIKFCRIKDAASIKLHLYLTAKTIMANIKDQNYLALQEVPDPETVQPLLKWKGQEITQYEYFIAMLAKVNYEQSYFNPEQMFEIMQTFRLTYARKHHVGTTVFGHAMLINPMMIKDCFRYQSNNDSESENALRAHLYLLTKIDGTPFVVANAHSDYDAATETVKHTIGLVDQGIEVCGDVNISAINPKHKEARQLISDMEKSTNYDFRLSLAAGDTYDIHVRLRGDAMLALKAQQFGNLVQREWKKIEVPFDRLIETEAVPKAHL